MMKMPNFHKAPWLETKEKRKVLIKFNGMETLSIAKFTHVIVARAGETGVFTK